MNAVYIGASLLATALPRVDVWFMLPDSCRAVAAFNKYLRCNVRGRLIVLVWQWRLEVWWKDEGSDTGGRQSSNQ